LITADETAPRRTTGTAWRAQDDAATTPLTQRLLNVTLFVTVLTSSFAMIEPSPHDVFVGVLAIVCLLAGVTIARNILPMLILLTLLNVGGLLSLFELSTQRDPLQYAAVSIYLATAAVLFACLVANDTSMRRMRIIETAYVLSAVIASAIGILAYFRAVPGADQFLLYGRVKSTFKDPNVFGPFLILPLMFLVQGSIVRGIRLSTAVASLIIIVGLFLSFSRGAWFHTALSALVMIALMILTAQSQRERVRIIGLSGVAAFGLIVLVIGLLSVSSLRSMLLERAQLIQSYDVGTGGRFQLQELAFGTFLDQPLGLGPFEFGRIYGLQQHNVYLQSFLVYGWLGGIAYLTLVVTTLVVGFRAALIRAPWQLYLIAAYATFVGEVAESFIIDSDHWRHYFLILGLVWGLSAATFRSRQMPKAINAPRREWPPYA
jgi:O-antigen ligase